MMQQMPTVVADKQQWQQNHPSQIKRYLKSCRLTSKHERVKVAERLWAHSRGHSASDRNTCTGREERKVFNPPNVHQIWPEKAFHMRSEASEKWKEVRLPSSEVIKNKNGNYVMVPWAPPACYFPHFSCSVFCSIYLHFQHSHPPFSTFAALRLNEACTCSWPWLTTRPDYTLTCQVLFNHLKNRQVLNRPTCFNIKTQMTSAYLNDPSSFSIPGKLLKRGLTSTTTVQGLLKHTHVR